MKSRTVNPEFGELVRNVLSVEYDLNLVPKTNLNIKGSTISFDYADVARDYYLGVVVNAKDREQIVHRVRIESGLFNTIGRAFYLLVFESALSKSDRKYFEKSIEGLSLATYRVFDSVDIQRLATKHGFKYFSNDSIKDKGSNVNLKQEVPQKKKIDVSQKGPTGGGPGGNDPIGENGPGGPPNWPPHKGTKEYNVYKLSHGNGVISHVHFLEMLRQGVVVVDENTKGLWSSKTTQFEHFVQARVGDFFYLCRSNSEIVLFAKFISEVEKNTIPGLDGRWKQRRYEVLKSAINNSGYKGTEKPWWSPSFNSTFRVIPKADYPKANEAIFNPFFGLPIESLVTLPSEKGKERSLVNIRSTIAPLSSDSDDGVDHFGINKDVEAFAKIITADSFKPPLAIALFGKWGTGKSFFMKKLWKKVESLSNTEKKNQLEHEKLVDESEEELEPFDPTYCTGVAQIHFNAWSYLDANLWASIVSKIFEGLQRYIDDDSLASQEKKVIEKELQEHLCIVKEERAFINQQKEQVVSKRKDLLRYRVGLSQQLDENIKLIKNRSLKDILDEVGKELKVEEKIKAVLAKDEVKDAKAKLTEIIPEEYIENPDLAIKWIEKRGTFVREFFRKDKIWLNIIALLGIVVILFSLPYFEWVMEKVHQGVVHGAKWVGTSIAVLLPTWYRYKKVYDRFQPLVSGLWKVKEDYDKEVKKALFDHEQKMEATKIAIENLKLEIAGLDNQMTEVDQEIEKIQFRLGHTLATETMYSFIEKRTKGDVYKKHLGIVSTIRRDFEVLSELFVESKEEGKHKKFREHFKDPLQRIVLYIDDLDRCSEERVVEVLEAVNLLMAFPLFVVVVGVDQRWIKNALIKKYRLQFTGALNGVGEHKEEEKELGLEQIDAINYLEKIFQVPFHLKRASDDGVKKMLRNLSVTVDNEPVENRVDTNIDQENEGGVGQENKTVVNEHDPTAFDNAVEGGSSYREIDDNEQEELKEHLALNKEEAGLMESLSSIIGNNPRAIKRFVNVYQILRAHAGLTLEGDKKKEEYLCLMFLLALPMGPYQGFYDEFIEFIYETDNQGKNLNHFLDNVMTKEARKDRGKLQLGGDDKFDEARKELLKVPVESLNRHSKFVRRFTFAEISV